MSSERVDDEGEKITQQHAQLLTKLPKIKSCYANFDYLYQYQGFWLFPRAVLGSMLMQTHLNHRPTDIFLSSYIKSGTTWLKSLMFTTLNRSQFEFSDHPLLRKGPHECIRLLDVYKPEDYVITDTDQDHRTPRLFNTHLGHQLLPSSVTDPSSGCKFVYVCRDPKDMLVSFWHFILKLTPKDMPPISIDQLFRRLCDDTTDYGPYWDHVLGFWEASVKSPGKILFLKYEEIKKDPEAHVKKLAEFMGVPISNQEEENGMVKKIVEFCSLGNLKSLEINKIGPYDANNAAVVPNHAFFRRGEVGDWKSHLTEEMKDKIDQITRDRFKDSGLTFGATP